MTYHAMLRAQQEVFDIMPDSKIGMEMAEAFEEAERPFRIKPLEWHEGQTRSLGSEFPHAYWRAQTPFDWGYRITPDKFGVTMDGKHYPNLEDAKAAGQANFKDRILAALEWDQ